MCAVNLQASEPKIKAEPAPEYEALFRNNSGWVGADGVFSVPLNDKTVLWLFSDTFVGSVKDVKRVDCTMINNSVGVESSGKVKFYYGTAKDGKPSALITPDDKRGYFWLFHGISTGKGLFIFLLQVEHVDNGTGFPFRAIGMSLGRISNPKDTPDKWHVTQQKVPYSLFDGKGDVFFGSSVLRVGPYIYIYGLDGRQQNGMILARTPVDKLDNFTSWKFYNKGQWTDDYKVCETLCGNMATEFSVSYIPKLRKYALVYTVMGISGEIAMRLSDKPEGPWGDPVSVYKCPDRNWHEKTYSYAAKAHPEISKSPDELIITYATNSMHFPDLFDDARLYWPRFIRLSFRSP